MKLSNLSKIGFGCHHVNNKIKEHEKALHYAILSGCNLIDVASNYQNGQAEVLVGKILNQLKIQNSNSIFVTTKGGYVSNSILKSFKTSSHLFNNEFTVVSDSLMNCIHPDFLYSQIKSSLKKFNSIKIGGYFLHNPEFYILCDKEAKQDVYYERIKNAFEFLEEMAHKNKIEYYGISESSGVTNFAKLIDLANEISVNNHFKLVQTPHNLFEESSIKEYILELKNNNILWFGNRPYSPRINNNLIILKEPNKQHDIKEINTHLEDKFSHLEYLAKEKGLLNDLTEIPIFRYLSNWNEYINESNFFQIYDSVFMPLTTNIIKDTKEDINDYYEIRNLFEDYLKGYYWNIALEKSVLNDNKSSDNFYLKLCQKYLDDGVDHVLVGMKKRSYVNDLKSLF